MHIVLIRFSSLGDVVLQTGLAAWLKLKFKDCKITFVTSKEFSSLVDDHDYIDDIILYKRSRGFDDIKTLYHLAQEISRLHPDFVIDLHGTLRAKLLHLFGANLKFIKVNKRTILRNILIRFKIDFLKKLKSHHERLMIDFSGILGKDYSRDELEDFINRESALTTIGKSADRESIDITFKKYFVISPVASFEYKRWPISKFNQLIQHFLADTDYDDYGIVIIAGPNDNYCKDIIENERVLNLQGKTTLAQSCYVLKHSELCITNDTGMAHISEAYGNPVISIFGPTHESFGFRPHLSKSQSISVDLNCRPCSATGSKSCHRDKHYCMLEISSEEVYATSKEILQVGG